MRQVVRLFASGFIVSLMLVSSFLPIQTFAVEKGPRESITLSPVNKRYQLDAGTVKTDTMTLINDGQVAYDFILYARPYSIHDESYTKPDFNAQTPNADAYQWVQFEQTRYHLEPGASVEVNYTLRLPADAAPGGHYGVLFAETQPSSTGSTSVLRKKRVGMVVYATVNGEFRMAGEHLNTSIPFLQFHAPLTAHTRIQNTGNSDFVVKTTHRVSDVFGGQKYNGTKDYPVLPQTTRKISFNWDKAPWFGLYRVDVSSAFLDQTHRDSGYVLIAPRWLLGIVGAVLVGGVVYVVLRRRR